MAVREIRHAPRCKFCKHAKLAEANALLERVSKRELSREDATKMLEALGIENPGGGDGWKKHWSSKGHYYWETEEDAEATAAANDAILDGLRDRITRGEKIDPDAVLDALIAQGMAEIELKKLEGKNAGVTIDHILKAISEKTKRKHNEAQDTLLEALGGGISAVFQKALGEPEQRPAIEGQVLDEAEFTEVGE